MAVTVSAVMRECNHYFVGSFLDAEFKIQGGAIETTVGLRLDAIALAGQYVAISDSVLNDGAYLVKENYTLDGLRDETFDGRLHMLHPSRDFLDLCESIAEFDTKTPVSVVASENIGNYGYAKATGQSGAVLGWEEAFAAKLRPYRRMFSDLEARG